MRIISLSFFNDTWIHSYPEFLLYKNLKEKFKADIDVVNCSKFFFSACTAHSMKQIPINGEKKIKDNYSFLSSIEKKKYGLSLKQLTDFQIKNFEFEFDKNNKRLMELENARIELDFFFKN